MLSSHEYLLLSGLKSELGFIQVMVAENPDQDQSLIVVKNYLEKRVAQIQQNDN
jgi:hypothetical protein|tara:strand:+ start:1454 stop:1615 length:162 start_codon:yes stop_codon:yes gene_type:complete